MTWGTIDAKSCNALLNRIDQNDPYLTELVVLPMKSFGDIELDRLSDILSSGKNNHLVQISASGHSVTPASLNKFAQALASSGGKNIKGISIGSDNMGDDGIRAFCEGLADVHGGFLESLDFSSKQLTSAAMKHLGITFGKSKYLKELRLFRNPIGDEGLKNFVVAAMSCGSGITMPSLKLLDLAECDIGSSGIKDLVTCLTDSTLETCIPMELILNRNPKIGSEGCSFIKDLISSPKSSKSRVEALFMRQCNIGDEGILHLGDAFKCHECRGFRHLDVVCNNIADGFIQFASLLKIHKDHIQDLTILDIADNSLGNDGVMALTKSLQSKTKEDGNFSITKLDLSNTNLGHEAAATLLKCTSLQSIRLFNNDLREGLDMLKGDLTGGHSTLLHLDLSGNRAPAATMNSLLKAISIRYEPDSSVLELLELGGNEINEEAMELIQELKRIRPCLDIAHDRPNIKN